MSTNDHPPINKPGFDGVLLLAICVIGGPLLAGVGIVLEVRWLTWVGIVPIALVALAALVFLVYYIGTMLLGGWLPSPYGGGDVRHTGLLDLWRRFREPHDARATEGEAAEGSGRAHQDVRRSQRAADVGRR